VRPARRPEEAGAVFCQEVKPRTPTATPARCYAPAAADGSYDDRPADLAAIICHRHRQSPCRKRPVEERLVKEIRFRPVMPGSGRLRTKQGGIFSNWRTLKLPEPCDRGAHNAAGPPGGLRCPAGFGRAAEAGALAVVVVKRGPILGAGRPPIGRNRATPRGSMMRADQARAIRPYRRDSR